MKKQVATILLLFSVLTVVCSIQKIDIFFLNMAKAENFAKLCPGSGDSCILWGLVYKGAKNSHVESIK